MFEVISFSISNKLNSVLSTNINLFISKFDICLHISLPIDPPAPVTKIFLFLKYSETSL